MFFWLKQSHTLFQFKIGTENEIFTSSFSGQKACDGFEFLFSSVSCFKSKLQVHQAFPFVAQFLKAGEVFTLGFLYHCNTLHEVLCCSGWARIQYSNVWHYFALSTFKALSEDIFTHIMPSPSIHMSHLVFLSLFPRTVFLSWSQRSRWSQTDFLHKFTCLKAQSGFVLVMSHSPLHHMSCSIPFISI